MRTVDPAVLAAQHFHLIRLVVFDMTHTLPPWVDRTDLISAAGLALASSAYRFDPDRGVKFDTYARYRMRGAINDAHRSSAWGPRRKPGDTTPRPLPLLHIIDTLPGSLPSVPSCADAVCDRIDMLRLIADLPLQQRQVIRASFYEGIPLGMIGERLGLTESRICQIRHAALRAMHTTLVA